MKSKRKAAIYSILITFSLIIILTILFNFTSIGHKKLTQKGKYVLELSGTVTSAGVIDYAGYEMNVYKNFASNPCGDCKDQPISIYAGTSARDTAIAIAKAVKRSNDMWEVQSVKDSKVTLMEKSIGTTNKPSTPSAPAGLKIIGKYEPAK